MRPKLTVGMATFADFNGVYFTVQSLRMHHADALRGAELVIVDNNPDSEDGGLVRDFLGWVKGDVSVKYVAAPEVTGTSAPRQRVFDEASGEYVVCMDCHVLLVSGALDHLLAHYRANPSTRDLLSGPMVYDDLRNRATHFADEWRGEMWGTWATDPAGDPYSAAYTGQPLEIPAMGLGLFSCRKDAWLGFHRDFRGFGGEEWYIHTKFRQAGARCLSLPGLGWVHRFGRPGGAKYPLSRWDKVRNYVIGHRELGLGLEPVYQHFVASGLLSQQHWDLILSGAERPPEEAPRAAPVAGGCGSCSKANKQVKPHDQSLAAKPATLEEWYEHARTHPSHLNEHAATLRELASQASHVVELGGERGQSTVALRAGCEQVTVLDPREWREDTWLAEHGVRFVRQSSQKAEPIACELLFIDTVHTAGEVYAELTRFAPHVTGRIVLHDTSLYGEVGQDGKAGLLVGLRQFLREHPAWSVKSHTQAQYGLTVLSNLAEDKKPLPSTMTQAWNYAKALARHVSSGAAPLADSQVQARLDVCATCEMRTENRCSLCGCFLDEAPNGTAGKAAWPAEQCPLGRWPLPVLEAK